jgi:hypothetical protein
MRRKPTTTVKCEDEGESFIEPEYRRQAANVLNTLWIILKVGIVLLIVFPFLDKLRHKDYITKTLNFINEYDIGCKPCECPICPNITASFNSTSQTKNGF